MRRLLSTLSNSYSILFFSRNRILGVILFAATFLHFQSGLAALVALLFATAILRISGVDKDALESGVYTFNSLLTGLAFGSYYQMDAAFWGWLAVTCVVTVVLSVNWTARLGKSGLPALSLPFVVSFWLFLLAHAGVPGSLRPLAAIPSIGLTQAAAGLSGVEFSGLPLLFFRALGAVIFQDSVPAGILIAVGVLVHSRIAFVLLLTGFVSAILFNSWMPFFPGGVSWYHLGANFMMVSLAAGGFFLVPSWRSFLVAILIIPAVFLVDAALGRVFGWWLLPVFSLPFCLVTNALLYFLLLRVNPGKLPLTAIQHYSPEKNLYLFESARTRQHSLLYLSLELPFLGAWKVSQGYNGNVTHQGDWSRALDFVIADEEGQTWKQPGTRPEDFYCFGKPVLAAADGTVEEIVDHVADNAIGQVDLQQNWGNSMVVMHAPGLYSKVSHLKQGSARFKKGNRVRQGDVLALCGNSGRSPEPHLHFQVQSSPFIGAKTIEYPFAHFMNGSASLHLFETPQEGDVVRPILSDARLKKAFTFTPGTEMLVKAQGREEKWEVVTDAWNNTVVRSGATSAWFRSSAASFYFTACEGPADSLLRHFFLAAWHVPFTTGNHLGINDELPPTFFQSPLLWLQDLIAPFVRFVRYHYRSESLEKGGGISVESKLSRKIFSAKGSVIGTGLVRVEGTTLTGFSLDLNGVSVSAEIKPITR